MSTQNEKLWGGRFTKATDAATDHFHSSISFDQRMYRQDICGSIAHCKMLMKQHIISAQDGAKILAGLDELLDDIEKGAVTFSEKAEDIHMNIESLLIERVGDAAKKLHTARSRNDQVALDTKMYALAEIGEISEMVVNLVDVLNTLADKHKEVIMPGYTHLQRAQPITFAHHILAYCEMFERDYGRLQDCKARTDDMPLGSGALATSPYLLDRDYVKSLLGFSKVTDNSLDAVSDRDFCIELLSALSILMMHLSRFCEELILWASFEFRFVEIDDAYATGSSIMPQKKNPDMAELIRGKTGRVYGALVTLLTVMKGLPLAYNKDMQEDKEALFDAIDTVKMCLPVFTGMMETIQLRPENMEQAAKGGFINATDCADYLVRKGAAFRDAHEVIGKLVLHCIDHNTDLSALPLETYRTFSPLFEEDVYDALSLTMCVNVRNVHGGPSVTAVTKTIAKNIAWVHARTQ